MSPLQVLQEAGRICRDASTFEAIGQMESRAKHDGFKRVKARWAFGPDGDLACEQTCGPQRPCYKPEVEL